MTAMEAPIITGRRWLTVTSKGWFRPIYLFMEDEHLVAVLRMKSGLREKGTLSINGENYELSRLGLMSGHFVMETDDGVEIADAEKHGMLREEIEVSYGESQLQVYKAKWWRERFVIVRDGEEIGSIAPRGLFSRAIELELPSDIPLELVGFLYWLVQVLWNRQGWVAAVGG